MAALRAFGLVSVGIFAIGCGGDDAEEGGSCGDTSACSATLAPSSDSTGMLQTKLIEAQSGDTVCLCPGKYDLTKEISLNVPNVTVRGQGKTRDDVVLDFANQTEGDDGMSVTSDGFTIENVSITNAKGNGIVVTGAEDVTFRNLKVYWDAGSVTSNGAYAVYPVSSKRVLVEDSEVIGASDAGIYVGQCTNVIVRNNVVHGNVAGIELENTSDAEAYGNEAYDNTGGFLVFTAPKLEKKDGARALVHDNVIRDNNRENFGADGTIVSNIPAGTGVLVWASDDTQISSNTIENNKSAGVLVVSLSTVQFLLGTAPDPETDPDPERTYIHGNTFTNNGNEPADLLAALGVPELEDVLWDGVLKAGTTDALCLGDPPLPTFRNFHVPDGGLNDVKFHTTDPTPHQCKHPDLPAQSW